MASCGNHSCPHMWLHLCTAAHKARQLTIQICSSVVSFNSQVPLELAILPRNMSIYLHFCCLLSTVTRKKSRFFFSPYVTFMHSRAARFASCVSVDGPLILDCSVPLKVSQLTKLSTVDSPLQIRRHQHQSENKNSCYSPALVEGQLSRPSTPLTG